MKNDLILLRYKTEPIIGTKTSIDPKTFFGSKMIDIEDLITVDGSIVQYSEVYDTVSKNNNGYQYYEDIDNIEKIYLTNLSDVKDNNHTINLLAQNTIDLEFNTNWSIIINWRDILTDYLFYRLKEARTFKCIRFNDVQSENINLYIRRYITNNLIRKYGFERIDFYVKYYELNEGDENMDPNLLLNPIFTVDVKDDDNLIKNVNVTVFDEILSLSYKQTESSKDKKFNYYFDLILNKI
jgi:hypothetical protein